LAAVSAWNKHPGITYIKKDYLAATQRYMSTITLGIWLPLIAVIAHLFEEFVWPGGFIPWYRNYPPGFRATVSTRFIVIINAIFVIMAVIPPFLHSSPRAWAFWLVVACIAGINGVFHLVATARARRYSPGVVTGALLYIPLALVGGSRLLQLRLVSTGTAVQAIIIAAVYQLWSSWKHRRASVAVARE
jgi:hypothetical protein